MLSALMAIVNKIQHHIPPEPKRLWRKFGMTAGETGIDKTHLSWLF